MARKEIFVLLLVSAAALATDYCSIQCQSGMDRVGCNAKNALGPMCPKGAEAHQYSESEKQLWLKLDNERRNQVASGSLTGFDSAKKMIRTTWNDELATLALYTVQTCDYKHVCANTDEYPQAGQNIAKYVKSDDYYTTEEAIKKAHEDWFNEYTRTTKDQIKSYPTEPIPEDKAIGHFTQIVRDESIQFGCAASNFKDNGMFSTYIVCNYGMTNIQEHPVYESGTACSGCENGCDKDYPALCKASKSNNDESGKETVTKPDETKLDKNDGKPTDSETTKPDETKPDKNDGKPTDSETTKPDNENKPTVPTTTEKPTIYFHTGFKKELANSAFAERMVAKLKKQLEAKGLKPIFLYP